MVNVYDTANKLAQEIRKSHEYLKYKTAKDNINSNLELKTKVEEFEKKRYEAHYQSLINHGRYRCNW